MYVSVKFSLCRSGLNGTYSVDFKAHFFTMSHFRETKFNKKKKKNSSLKEGFFSNPILCLETCPLMLKTKCRVEEKNVCYLPCQTVCVFYIDTILRTQPNMVALPNLTWLSVKQDGTMAYDWYFLLKGWLSIVEQCAD